MRGYGKPRPSSHRRAHSSVSGQIEFWGRFIVQISSSAKEIKKIIIYPQGFVDARVLAKKLASMVELCDGLLSSQPHYEFGLRLIKKEFMWAPPQGPSFIEAPYSFKRAGIFFVFCPNSDQTGTAVFEEFCTAGPSCPF